jgi:ABC-type transport system substrate-binding protein
MIGPPGQISPNFSRTADPEIDAALEAGRQTLDIDERARHYRTITQRLNEQVAYVWLHRTPNALVAQPDVGGLWGPAQSGFGRADAKPWLARLWLRS